MLFGDSLVHDIVTRFHHRAALVCVEYSNFAGVLEMLKAMSPDAIQAAVLAHRLEVLGAYGFQVQPQQVQQKPFAFAEGTAVIPMHGLLLNRLSWGSSFATGYNFIRDQVEAATLDKDVERIVYDVNSGGGSAAGCSELADDIALSTKEKPSIAVVDSKMYSAAYFLGSQAGKVVATPSSGVGSIGCVAMHIDYSAALKKEGINLEYIFKGKEKVDGNPYQALTPRARAGIERDVTYHYDMFVGAVARGRNMKERDVKATEAGCFLPPEAKEKGLIDAILPASAAITAFRDGALGKGNESRPAGGTTTTSSKRTEDMDEAEVKAAIAEGIATGLAESRAADRKRRSEIMALDEAKDRPKLAAYLVNETDMTVDAAKAMLAVSAKETPEKPAPTAAEIAAAAAAGGGTKTNHFAEAMDRTVNPNVGADGENGGGAGGEEPTPEKKAAGLIANFTAMTGQKFKELPKTAA